MIEHPPGQKILLFSFGSKTDGKKVTKVMHKCVCTSVNLSVFFEVVMIFIVPMIVFICT